MQTKTGVENRGQNHNSESTASVATSAIPLEEAQRRLKAGLSLHIMRAFIADDGCIDLNLNVIVVHQCTSSAFYRLSSLPSTKAREQAAAQRAAKEATPSPSMTPATNAAPGTPPTKLAVGNRPGPPPPKRDDSLKAQAAPAMSVASANDN